jgi:hypothetical protein
MPSISTKLDSTIAKFAADKLITKAEAKKIVEVAKQANLKKPITELLKAVDKLDAGIEVEATRLIASEFNQPMSKSEWTALAQKCASGAGVWGASSGSSGPLKRSDLPAGVAKRFDAWAKDSREPVRVSMMEVAGKPLYMLKQDAEDQGEYTSIFDESGKQIEMKQDVVNIDRLAKRTQQNWDKQFKAPDMKNWSDAIGHTEIGVTIGYYDVAKDIPKNKWPAAVAATASEIETKLKSGSKVQVFQNKKDGTFLVVGNSKHYDRDAFALFSKQGALVREFNVN